MKIKLPLTLIAMLMLSSCQAPELVQNAVENLKRLAGISIQPQSKKESSEKNEVAKTKANAEILAEMFQVTFMTQEMDDLNLFNGLVASLNQGASLEGVYRGLVMGSRYRVLESKSKAAAPNALKFFSLEMAEIQESMRNPTRFHPETAKRIPTIDYPEGDSGEEGASDVVSEKFNDGEEKKSKEQKAREYLEIFIGATPFTLKRVISEELLRKMDEMNPSSGEVAQWYSDCVLRLIRSKIDFGLPQRNSDDFDFHFKFAKTMALDRVKWEVLNRYHRILNQLDR